MQVFENITELKRYLREIQARGLRIALVPTMGALHEGHLQLIDLAKTRAEVTVASIFVNPKQFGQNEDFGRYPRVLAQDSEKLAARGASVLFAPSPDEIYPDAFATHIEVETVSRGLCGDHRPGHFRGVATVVLKLLNIVRPDAAIFGEKDFQQLAVIRRMAKDLDLDTEIVGAPTVREPDGLAMSSRNMYLSAEDRQRALAIHGGLRRAKIAFDGGEVEGRLLLREVESELERVAITPQYLELRAFDDLSPLTRADRPSILLIAAYVGSTRLIDNLILRRP